MAEDPQIITAGQDSVKLIKNTKGYNWEIKCYENRGSEKGILERIEGYDKYLKQEYGKEKGD